MDRCELCLSFLLLIFSPFPCHEPDFAKDEAVDVKEESHPVVVSSGYPFWVSEQHSSHGFPAASPLPSDQREGLAREQQMPAPSYQTYR